MEIELRIKMRANAGGESPRVPAYETEGSAAFDLRALLDAPVLLKSGARDLIPTGLFVEIPQNYVGLIFARSGLAVKNGISLTNAVGVIDSDYRGEIKVAVVNLSDTDFLINSGDRIAQFALMPVLRAKLSPVQTLSESARGEGGFGSTGIG